MRKTVRILFCTLALATLTSTQYSYAQLSDSQIRRYITEGQAAGKSNEQILNELSGKGITASSLDDLTASGSGVSSDISRYQSEPVVNIIEIPADATSPGKTIFGHNIFNNKYLTFEPSVNIATPASYTLGPGDEVIIDVWGINQTSIRSFISPDGSIFISGIGPVYLSGMTVSDANKALQREFSRIYSGIEGDASHIKLTLGQIRSIQINVMGEAVNPGTYNLSAFATAFHALYQAGGVNEIGSLRSISVIRNSRRIATIDMYDYILRGSTSDFIRLDEGDVIIVPPYEKLVQIKGSVKRPMYYELKGRETLADLINYAGGFSGDAFSANVGVIRFNGMEKQVINVENADFASFILADGDQIDVQAVLDRYENRIQVTGAVRRPGVYELNQNVSTVRQLIEQAQGLRGDEFRNRAVITRELYDRTLETIPIDLQGIMDGTVRDVELQNYDVLYVPSIHDLSENRTLVIYGAVSDPGTYPYAANTTIEDLIIMAGGLRESASEMRIDVARRVKDPRRTEEVDFISISYTFSLRDGFLIDADPDFYLQPYDHVYVRRSPGYEHQQNVTIVGEILYEGKYAISRKNERLSDLVWKAGGLTSGAYVSGARLVRKMNDEERSVRDALLKVAEVGGSGGDSVSLERLDISNSYNVGIELEKALMYPGTDYDMVIREGDMLVIPQYNNTVKINGHVLYSNTVVYKPGENLRYYIDQAGGYAPRAKKRKVYIIHMNGTVSRYRNSRSIDPGCQIVVPSKSENSRLSMQEILSIGTTAASLGTMGAVISNIIK